MQFYHAVIQLLFTGASLVFFSSQAQVCPPNIDFEKGNFSGWTCYTGTVGHVNGQNQMYLYNSNGPVQGQHTIFPRSANPVMDEYGDFPVNCPNGSGYSVRLGNDMGGTEAEGLSYEFTIPANQNVYSLIYHYAVVFEDPNHEIYEQPRLEIEVTNVTDNKTIHCSSFTFIPYGTILPGFYQSRRTNSNAPIWCKDWSAVSINLNGHAGKTIRLFFKTADCTFRRHFGYAYIDVNSECSNEFTGSVFCPGDSAVTLTAPFGYQKYAWFDRDFKQELGVNQAITFTPAPAAGSVYSVKVTPYDGYGCIDTFYARLSDTLTILSYAGPDMLSCNGDQVALGTIPKPGLSYSWSPKEGLSDPNTSNPFAAPAQTTAYILTTSSNGGGCASEDTVVVKASFIDNTIQLKGSDRYCSDSEDSALLSVQPMRYIQWLRNNEIISLANRTEYRVPKTGIYHALLENSDGCIIATNKQEVIIDDPRPGIRYPMEYAVVDHPLGLKARQFGDNILWSPGTWLNTQTSYTPEFIGKSDQQYTMEIRTRGNCLTVDTVMVKTVTKVDMHVPNAFTPNGDGRNDFLRPVLMGVKELRYFRIYNRWGKLLLDVKTAQPGWDGTINGIPQPTQTVVWTLEGTGLDGTIHRRKGTTVLVR